MKHKAIIEEQIRELQKVQDKLSEENESKYYIIISKMI
jgi:hypothetical protein